jgi:hypothetical protein
MQILNSRVHATHPDCLLQETGNSQAELKKEGDAGAVQHHVQCELAHDKLGSGLAEVHPTAMSEAEAVFCIRVLSLCNTIKTMPCNFSGVSRLLFVGQNDERRARQLFIKHRCV